MNLITSVTPRVCFPLQGSSFQSVVVFEDNNLIFLNNILLSVLFAYRISKEAGLSFAVLARNPRSIEM